MVICRILYLFCTRAVALSLIHVLALRIGLHRSSCTLGSPSVPWLLYFILCSFGSPFPSPFPSPFLPYPDSDAAFFTLLACFPALSAQCKTYSGPISAVLPAVDYQCYVKADAPSGAPWQLGGGEGGGGGSTSSVFVDGGSHSTSWSSAEPGDHVSVQLTGGAVGGHSSASSSQSSGSGANT